jgi:hypothetical protein
MRIGLSASAVFAVTGAVAAALSLVVTGMPVFGSDYLDAPIFWPAMGAGAGMEPRETPPYSTSELAAANALGYFLLRLPAAVLFGWSWVLYARSRRKVFLLGTLLLPLAFELLCALFPLSATWLSELVAAVDSRPDPPGSVLPLEYVGRLTLSHVGPPMVASVLSLLLLARLERRTGLPNNKTVGK